MRSRNVASVRVQRAVGRAGNPSIRLWRKRSVTLTAASPVRPSCHTFPTCGRCNDEVANGGHNRDKPTLLPHAPALVHEKADNTSHNNVLNERATQANVDAKADYPDYFFDLCPMEEKGENTNSNTTIAPVPSQHPSAFPPAPPQPSSAPPPPMPPTAGELLPGGWVEFQHYLRHMENTNPDFSAHAGGFTPVVLDREGSADTLGEVSHMLHGASSDNAYSQRKAYDASTDAHADTIETSTAPSLPPMSMEVVTDLEHDLAQECALESELDNGCGDSDRCGQNLSNSSDFSNDGAGVEFGHDAETDAQMLAALKGRTVRLQNDADTVDPPLLIPGKDGKVTTPHTAAPSPAPLPSLDIPRVHLLSSQSFLVQQDRLYLSPRTPPAAQLLPPGTSTPSSFGSSTATSRQCILVVFSANDLRVHDNHLLALASLRARTALSNDKNSSNGTSSPSPLPVIAVCVLDYRTFAQPSVVGGFFRQSPQRAQYLLLTVAALRHELESKLNVPLLVRCGRPEEHVPRLAAELGATDVFVTTQYAPHERRVQEVMLKRLRAGVWVSREDVTDALFDASTNNYINDKATPGMVNEQGEEVEDPLIAVVEHSSAQQHPYGDESMLASQRKKISVVPPVVHSVWQTTLVHLDDLPTPLAAMKEGERWYHDDVTVSTIRPTEPYDKSTRQLADLPLSWQQQILLPSREEIEDRASPSVLRGVLPTLEDLGYAAAAAHGVDFAFEEVIATQSSHPTAGEKAAFTRLHDWLADGGVTSLLRYGRERRTNTKMYSQKLARVSPYIAVGALSPRTYYEILRQYAHENLRDGFVQQQFREAVLRLSRRDYWHWMGLRFGDRLFFSYGPHPEQTDEIADWRHDPKVVQRWCNALTGIPFADAAMRELIGTGFVAHEGRQALAWLLTRGYGQDWRLGAEWMERCSLDYDPFVCYGNFAYASGLLLDDFGEPVRNVHYLAHHHDQTGIYVKKWLPQLSKVPPVYIHRPHVLTPRMQAMHNVYLGKNYPYPLKLWQGAQRTLSKAELTAYYAEGIRKGPGYAEALRYGRAVMPPEEFNAAVHPAYVQQRTWASMLPASAFADVPDRAPEVEEKEKSSAFALAGTSSAARAKKPFPQVVQPKKAVV